jgi:DNA-binding LytR/AlgR family response regulator
MNILIVEDEKIAVRRLTKLLSGQIPDARIVASTDTIKGTIDWFAHHPMPDLMFVDIHLADGISFEIFSKVEITCPVIFTTAYDEYALKAFEVNSIDYLLKPIDHEKLIRALKKFEKLTGSREKSLINNLALNNAIELLSGKKYKERFVVRYGQHLKSIAAGDITCFYSESKATIFISTDKIKYIVDYTMDQVVSMVDPGNFFRINRKFIISLKSIRDIITWSNSRLKLVLHDFDHPELIVAREKTLEFRKWLDR